MLFLQHFLKQFNYLNTIRTYTAILANQTHEKKNKLKGGGLTSRFENLLRKLQK